MLREQTQRHNLETWVQATIAGKNVPYKHQMFIAARELAFWHLWHDKNNIYVCEMQQLKIKFLLTFKWFNMNPCYSDMKVYSQF